MVAKRLRCDVVASALNQVLHLDETDQTSLLAVIEEYFTLPSAPSAESESSEESDPEYEVSTVGTSLQETCRANEDIHGV